MSLGLFNCRLIQLAGDQLFFFQKCINRRACERQESRAPDPLLLPFAFFSVGFVWKVGAVSRARDFCAAKRTLDTALAFHRMSMESEGKKPLKS